MLTHDFTLRGSATRAAGWLSFHVDRGDGGEGEGQTPAALELVALVAFAREADTTDDDDGGLLRVLRRLAPQAAGRQLPPAPLAVAVLLAEAVPSVVREMLTKSAAGFFSREF
jgi:hypothetical protein